MRVNLAIWCVYYMEKEKSWQEILLEALREEQEKKDSAEEKNGKDLS